MIIKNDKRVSKIYDGENVVQRIYKGTDKIYEYLPVGYTECSYIESTGTQRIKLNILPTTYSGNYIIELKMQLTSLPTSNRYCFGAGPTTSGRSCNTRINTDGSLVVYNQIINGNTAKLVAQLTTAQADLLNKNTYKIKVINNGITTIIKDETSYTENETSNSNTGSNFRIFDGLGSNTSLKMKLYSFKLWNGNNNKISRYLIPCLDDNNVPCLYDLVTKTTYYNDGTGTFDYATL